MNIKNFFAKNWIHFAFIAAFIIIAVAYFAPQFDGNGLKQYDIEQFKGMSNEIVHHREETGQEPLWTNSMFGGMPATQISVIHKGNVFRGITKGLFEVFSAPAGIFLLHMLCFYILALILRIKPLIGFLGALAFSFASYEIIILHAGHNSKAIAVAFMPGVLGAFILAFRRNWKWGAALSAVFMAFELSANHFQVTYYLAFLLLALGVFFLVQAIKEKKIKDFGFATVGVLVGYGLAIMMNYGNIKMTNDYAKDTIRGTNDITIATNGLPPEVATTGLDKDYITHWSYGKDESFTLLSPYVMGSHSAALGNTHLAEIAEGTDLSRSSLAEVMKLPVYWGEQPGTSGPVYLGVLTVLLAFLGLIFIKDRIKWVYFGVALLALMLSWGKNFMGLTDFFIDNVPLYNKFRTVTIIMVVIELCMPVLAILVLQKFYTEREELKEKKKLFMYASGAFLAFLFIIKFMGIGNYSSGGDARIMDQQRGMMLEQISKSDPAVLLQQYNVDVNNPQQIETFIDAQLEPLELSFGDLRIVRAEIFSSSMTRSIIISIFGILIIGLFFFTKIPSPYMIVGLSVVMLADLVPVDLNYLGSETDTRGNYLHWVPKAEQLFPTSSQSVDLQILENEIKENPELAKVVADGESKGKKKAIELEYSGTVKNRVIDSYKFSALNRATNYRVFDMSWTSSRASYFHKNLGGYHGAKLRNIQNLFDFHISRSNNNVFNMMNVKYFIQGDKVNQNPEALGNAWLVKTVREFDSPNDEIRALGKQFSIKNVGPGTLYVNDEKQTSIEVYGGEDMVYILSTGDSLEVPLSNGLTKGLKAVFVMDVNGATNLVPEITLEMDTANSFTRIANIEVTEDFAPAEEAVMLKSEGAKLSTKKYTAEGSVKLVSYEPNELKYKADLKGKQLVVFSEVYYNNGWTAYVDGKEQDILKVNYILRGLEVDGGKHDIEFKFNNPIYKTSNTMAYVGSVLILLIIAGLAFMDFKGGKPEEEKTAA